MELPSPNFWSNVSLTTALNGGPFGLGPEIIALIPTMQGDESCAWAVKQLKMNVVAAANTAHADVFSIVTRSGPLATTGYTKVSFWLRE